MPCQTWSGFRLCFEHKSKGFTELEIGCRGKQEIQGLSHEQKNAGSATVTLNPRSQPRLPGSVVGEASMSQDRKTGKITEVIVLW
jgi:hypothetical protein